jgi:hypothetical protein
MNTLRHRIYKSVVVGYGSEEEERDETRGREES